MTVWLTRAGRYGERETLALEQGLSVIGWEEVPDLACATSRSAVEEIVRATYPDAGKGRIANWVGQLWAFRERMQEGDLVVLPLKTQAAIAIGKVAGPYAFRTDLGADVHHTRPVTWIKTDIPRARFDQDLLYTFGAFMTVCQIKRHNDEERIKAMLGGQPVPPTPADEADEDATPVDIEQFASDDLTEYLTHKFKGHELARLVDEILQTQGYQTLVSPAGADGGVDIIAGSGSMGFDSPRLCVQVKSSETAAGASVLRELQGTMKNFGADQGLLVSWGGFAAPLLKEARHLHFEIRLWDAGDVVANLLRRYDQLSPGIQAELPLKRIWVRVPEAGGEEG
jgi:restriction system protein